MPSRMLVPILVVVSEVSVDLSRGDCSENEAYDELEILEAESTIKRNKYLISLFVKI